MTVEINKDMVRLLVLDISGTYSKIHDEIYTTFEDELNVINKYSNINKFLIVRTMWIWKRVDWFSTLFCNYLQFFDVFHWFSLKSHV